jgi:membrane protease YdiL (CAAX protease family)
MTLAFEHLLAVYLIVVGPWLYSILYQKARRRLAAGDPLARIRLYRVTVADQVVNTFVVLGLWRWGGIPATNLGLGAPRSWWLSGGLTALLGGLLLWSGIRLRRKATKIPEKLKGRVDALLPDTAHEQRWFAVVSVGAGIAEELTYRGFLFYYASLWFPHINSLEKALLTSVIFGVAHIYQGWKGVVPTGVSGLILAGLYLLSGNLLLPVVVHAVVDLRALAIAQPQAAGGKTAAEAA